MAYTGAEWIEFSVGCLLEFWFEQQIPDSLQKGKLEE